MHEQIVVKGKIGWLKNDLLHYPFRDFLEYLNKANRYVSLVADEYQEQNVGTGFSSMIKYLLIIPKLTFFNLYIRHRGFTDGFPGFVFALFSAIQKAAAYVRYWEIVHVKKIH